MNSSRLVRLAPLARHAVAASLTSFVLLVWLGACGTDNEACGVNGLKNGTCQVGPTCPSGSDIILIADPSDACPLSNAPGGENYVCCGPVVSNDAGTVSYADAAKTPPG